MSACCQSQQIYRIECSGAVQGRGIRPEVARIATELSLTGVVFNHLGGVQIWVMGTAPIVETFYQRLQMLLGEAVTLAIDESSELPQALNELAAFKENRFEIIASERVSPHFYLPVDLGICSDCVSELSQKNVSNRYDFLLNACAKCGPRYSVLQALPFDRSRTSMADFNLCSGCRDAYETIGDRRHHAQLIHCLQCGPKYWLALKGSVEPVIESAGIIEKLVEILNLGGVVAIKGVGGFHLVCDATQSQAVERIRTIKQRPHKPLVIMGHLELLKTYSHLDEKAIQLVSLAARPVVVVAKAMDTDLKSVAPGLNDIGVMLPYTAIQYQLAQAMNRPLVVTSANLTGCPMPVNNDEMHWLENQVEAIAYHDRGIINPIEDSVMLYGYESQVVRMGRGLSPTVWPVAFFQESKKAEQKIVEPKVIAFGADLKNTFAFYRDGEIYVSPYLGHLSQPVAQERLQSHLQKAFSWFDFKPDVFAVDAHPDYQSSRIGLQYYNNGIGSDEPPEYRGIVPVQHHHAHAVAAMVEWQIPLTEYVYAIVMDGLGWGDDNTLWGGEIFYLSGCDYQRLGHHQPFPMVGGNLVSKQPWRNALAVLSDMPLESQRQLKGLMLIPEDKQTLAAQVEAILSSATSDAAMELFKTSSVGRLFDAMAALLGFPYFEMTYEGQAAQWLQSLAEQTDQREYGWRVDDDVSPDIHIADFLDQWVGVDWSQPGQTARVAFQFHCWLVDTFSLALKHFQLHSHQGEMKTCKKVVLSGGVMQNQLLVDLFKQRLAKLGFQVYAPQRIPSNDEGVALGQAAIAATRYRIDHICA